MKNFWAYYKCLNMGLGTTSSREQIWGVYLAIGGLFFYLILMGNLGGESMPITVILCAFFGGGISSAFIGTHLKPSLYRQLPVSSPVKILYFFLSCLVNFAIILVCMLVVAAVTALFIALIIFIASGEWILVVEESAEEIPAVCAQGEILAVLSMLFTWGVLFAAGPCRRRLFRWGAVYAATLAQFIPLKIYCVLNGIKAGELFICFDAVPLSWVLLLIYGLASAAMLAFGIYRAAVHLKAKNY